MTSLSVVHTTNSFKFDGTGHTVSTFDLAVEQVRRGYRVRILCGETDAATQELVKKYGVEMAAGAGLRGLRSIILADRSAYRRVLADADVVHIHTVKSGILSFVARPWFFSRRSVATIHNPHQRTSLAMVLSRRVVVLSQAQARSVLKRTLGVVRAVVIPNGSVGSPRLEASFLAGEGVDEVPDLGRQAVLFVGALHGRKGIDVLIRAMQQVVTEVPDARLYVVGNRDNPAIEELARTCGLSEVVKFVGFVPVPSRYMMAATVFVLPSRREGFGNVLTEARLAGVPIIASRTGGIPEALADGAAGILVEPGDVSDLADRLIELLRDEHARDELSTRAMRGLEFLAAERVGDAYESVYKTVVARRSR